jgi:AcrR family transcriptional regulator
MARTLNPEAHAVRRDAFVEAAQRLLQTKGYEQLSIQDVLDETGSSKGAFYHYFDSKEALLDAAIDRIVDAGLAAAQPIADDPELSAVEKFRGIFITLAGWKNARKDLMLAVLQVWMSDDNTVTRERSRSVMLQRLTPLFTEIARQGKSEGAFDIDSPESTALVLVSLVEGANEAASRLFFERHAGKVSLGDVLGTFKAYEEAFERILGAPPLSLPLADPAVIHDWFD